MTARRIGDDAGPWPAFVDLLSATTLLFIVLFAVFTVPGLKAKKEQADVKLQMDSLEARLKSALAGRRVTIPKRIGNRLLLRIEGDATFPVNQSDLSSLSSEGKLILRQAATAIRADSIMERFVFQLEVVGHASREGATTTNWPLSASRAAAVAQFLVDSIHLNPCKVAAIGRANYYPANAASTSVIADPRDRRIEIEVVPSYATDTVQAKLLARCPKR